MLGMSTRVALTIRSDDPISASINRHLRSSELPANAVRRMLTRLGQILDQTPETDRRIIDILVRVMRLNRTMLLHRMSCPSRAELRESVINAAVANNDLEMLLAWIETAPYAEIVKAMTAVEGML